MRSETFSPCSSWGPWSWRYRGTSWSGSSVACLYKVLVKSPLQTLEVSDCIAGVSRTLLTGGLLNLVGGTDADQTVVRLELLQGLLGVVDQSETGALATTVLCAETEDGDLVLVGLVQVGQLLTELILGDVGAVGVEDVPGNRDVSRAILSIRFFFFGAAGKSFVVSVSPSSVSSFVCMFRFHPRSPIVQFLVHRGKGKGELTRPSACGQAEGCG